MKKLTKYNKIQLQKLIICLSYFKNKNYYEFFNCNLIGFNCEYYDKKRFIKFKNNFNKYTHLTNSDNLKLWSKFGGTK